jgi:hypothetical protein
MRRKRPKDRELLLKRSRGGLRLRLLKLKDLDMKRRRRDVIMKRKRRESIMKLNKRDSNRRLKLRLRD